MRPGKSSSGGLAGEDGSGHLPVVMIPIRSLAACWFVPLLLAGCAAFEEPPIPVVPSRVAEAAPGTGVPTTAAETPPPPSSPVPYPFTTCAVIRKDLNGAPKYKRIYRNHEIQFCCTPCLHAFEANPEAYFPRIAEAAAAKARGEAVNSGW